MGLKVGAFVGVQREVRLFKGESQKESAGESQDDLAGWLPGAAGLPRSRSHDSKETKLRY